MGSAKETLKAKARQLKGKMTEANGIALDNDRMRAEGRGEQMRGKAQERAAKQAKKSSGH